MPFLAALIPVLVTAAINIGVSLIVGAIASALSPKPGLKSSMQVSISANDGRRIIFGRAGTAGSLLTFQSWGSNNSDLAILFRVADHKCQGFAPQISITGTTANGSTTISSVSSTAGLKPGMPIGFSGGGTNPVPTGAWIVAIPTSSSIVISQAATANHSGAALVANASVYWSGQPVILGGSGEVPKFHANGRDNCWVTFFNGDWNQTADADMIAHSNGRWTSNDRGRGCAYVKIKAHADAKAFSGGVQMLFQFTFVIDGAMLYDRRLDTSVGGSGTQRFNDQSTWTLNSNSAVVAENILRGIRVEDTSAPVGSRAIDTFFGLALTDADLPFTENTVAMNHCDEVVNLNAGGTELRYACNGSVVLDPSTTIESVLADVLLTMAGKFVQSPGRFYVTAGVAQTPVRTFTDADFRLDGPYRFTNDIPLDQIANAVVGQFADPASSYTGQPLPPRISSADELADGGGVASYKAQQVDLSYVTSFTQGQRIQEIARRKQRLQHSAQLAVAPENLDLEASDWITWTSARYGWTKTFEINLNDGKGTGSPSDQFMIVVDCEETASSAYGWTPSTDELSRFAPSILPSADPSLVAVTTLTAAMTTIAGASGGAQPAIAVTYDALTDPRVVGIRFTWVAHGLPAGAPQVSTQDFAVNPATSSGTQSQNLIGGIVEGYQYDVSAEPITVPPQDDNWTTVTTAGNSSGTVGTGSAPTSGAVLIDSHKPGPGQIGPFATDVTLGWLEAQAAGGMGGPGVPASKGSATYGFGAAAGENRQQATTHYLLAAGDVLTCSNGDANNRTASGRDTTITDNGASNLAIWAEDLTQSAYTRTNLSQGTSTTNPLTAVSNAQLWRPTTTNAAHTATQDVASLTAGAPYTLTVYLKPSTRKIAQLQLGNTALTNTCQITVDVSAGTVTVAAAASGTAVLGGGDLTSVGSGWYRVRITGTFPAITTLRCKLGFLSDAGASSWAGDNVTGLFVWGLQLTKAAAARAYWSTSATAGLAITAKGGGDATGNVPASGTVSFSGVAAVGNTVTVNATTFSFVASGATGTNVNVGSTASDSAANLSSVINANSTSGANCGCNAIVGGATVTVNFNTAGTGGNGTTLAKSGANITVSGNLAGGANAAVGVHGTGSGGDTTTAGHDGGLTNPWDGGSNPTYASDQTTPASEGTIYGGGSSGGAGFGTYLGGAGRLLAKAA